MRRDSSKKRLINQKVQYCNLFKQLKYYKNMILLIFHGFFFLPKTFTFPHHFRLMKQVAYQMNTKLEYKFSLFLRQSCLCSTLVLLYYVRVKPAYLIHTSLLIFFLFRLHFKHHIRHTCTFLSYSYLHITEYTYVCVS